MLNRLPPYHLKSHRLTILLFLSVLGIPISCRQNQEVKEIPWSTMDAIVKNMIPPTFPDKNFNILEFGAVPDRTTDNTDAFAEAIKMCFAEGGGKVLVPDGKYLSGPPL